MRFSMNATMCVLAIAGVLDLGTSAHADIINVPGDQPTIQAGIDAASDGDEVVVAPGTYNEIINFNGKPIKVRSSDGPEVTTIDGTDLNDSVVKCINGEGPKTMLQGFSVTGGLAEFGGGMRIGDGSESSPSVSGCVFMGNMAEAGGAISARFDSSPTVTECIFRRNFASAGAGIYHEGSGTVTLSNCVFIDNITTDQGCLVGNEGDWTITNCIFVRNIASVYSGAAQATGGSVSISNCVFSENQSGFSGGGIQMMQLDTDVTVEQSLFVNNTSRTGGGMYLAHASASVIDCVIVGNQASDDAGGIFALGTPTIGGSLFCGNTPNDIVGDYNDAGGNEFPKQRPGIGACCIGDDCVIMTQTFCASFNGTYQGDETQCDADTCAMTCPADLSDDDVVNAKDLAQLLGAWGPCRK